MREDVVGSENGGMSGVSDSVGAVGAQRVEREGTLDSMGELAGWGRERCGWWNDTPSPPAAAHGLLTFSDLEQQLKGLQDEDDKHDKRLVWII